MKAGVVGIARHNVVSRVHADNNYYERAIIHCNQRPACEIPARRRALAKHALAFCNNNVTHTRRAAFVSLRALPRDVFQFHPLFAHTGTRKNCFQLRDHAVWCGVCTYFSFATNCNFREPFFFILSALALSANRISPLWKS